MKFCLRLSVLPLLLIVAALTSAQGDVVFESALLGPTGQMSGYLLNASQFLGTRFHLDTPVLVQHVGGHMLAVSSSSSTIFGAIYPLSSPTAFPSGNPFDSPPLASTLFTPPLWYSQDILVPLSASLMPGDYALIFGGGQLGATGEGLATGNNIALPGASLLTWSGLNGGWFNYYPVDAGHGPLRFVVEGVVVPEPGPFALLALGAALAVLKFTGRIGGRLR